MRYSRKNHIYSGGLLLGLFCAFLLFRAGDAAAEERPSQSQTAQAPGGAAERARLKREEEIRKRAEEEARRRVAELEKARERARRAAAYLGRSRESLEGDKFDQARAYAEKALRQVKDSRAARSLLARIDEAEKAHERQRERLMREKEARKKVEKEAGEQARQEEEQKRFDKKIEGYLSKARARLLKKDYSEARRWAYKAREEAPESGEVAAVITEIDKEEMFRVREGVEEVREKKIAKAIKEAEKEEDPFRGYDEGKGWMDQVTGIFKKKRYELGDIREERTYTVDECVQLALNRSQRMIMADRQVKLAEMRLWEARRGLFPSVTGKYEMSTGKISTTADAETHQRHYRGRKYKVEVKQTVFDGMGSWFAVRQSQANLEVTKLEREKIKNEIIEAVKKAYYTLDKAFKALDVQRGHKETVNLLYGIIERSHLQELISRTEYLKVKGQSIQADFQHISAEGDVDVAEMILFQAMNVDPDRRIKIKPVPKPGRTLSIGLENCYRLALANRPDLKVKKKMIEYYSFERKMMKAKGWPKIEFNGSFGASVEKYEPMFADSDWETPEDGSPSLAVREWEAEWYAGARGSIPLWGNTFEYNYVKEKWAPTVSAFRGSESATSYFNLKFLDDMAYFSNLQEARAGFESAKYEYLKERKDIIVEVKELYFRYRKALLQMDVSRAQLEHQRMFVDVLEERRRFGEMEASKVIEEYEKLAEHEYGAVHADTSYFISLAELSRGIGIPDYFKPGYENVEYDQWQKHIAESKAATERKRKRDEIKKKAEKEARKKAM